MACGCQAILLNEDVMMMTHGVRKIRNFRPISRYILETVHDRPAVTMERYQQVIGGRPIRVSSDDLE